MNDDIKVRGNGNGNGKHLCSSNGASRSTGRQRSSCRRSTAPTSVQMDVAYNLHLAPDACLLLFSLFSEFLPFQIFSLLFPVFWIKLLESPIPPTTNSAPSQKIRMAISQKRKDQIFKGWVHQNFKKLSDLSSHLIYFVSICMQTKIFKIQNWLSSR